MKYFKCTFLGIVILLANQLNVSSQEDLAITLPAPRQVITNTPGTSQATEFYVKVSKVTPNAIFVRFRESETLMVIRGSDFIELKAAIEALIKPKIDSRMVNYLDRLN